MTSDAHKAPRSHREAPGGALWHCDKCLRYVNHMTEWDTTGMLRLCRYCCPCAEVK